MATVTKTATTTLTPAQKAVITRRANVLARVRSERAQRAWETRRAINTIESVLNNSNA